MKSERTQYKVDIFGEHYALVSDESAELIFNATHMVNTLMKEIATKSAGSAGAGIDIKKVAILAALQLAGQLVNMKNVHEATITKHVDKHIELITKMTHVLNAHIQ